MSRSPFKVRSCFALVIKQKRRLFDYWLVQLTENIFARNEFLFDQLLQGSGKNAYFSAASAAALRHEQVNLLASG